MSLVPTALAEVLRLMRLTADSRGRVDTRSAAQAAASPVVHSERIKSSSYTPHHQPQDQASGGGAAARAKEAPDESGGRDAESFDCDRLFWDSPAQRPGEPVGGGGSISAPTTADLLRPPHARNADGHTPPLDSPGCPLPYIPNRALAGGDESLPDEGACAQQSQCRLPTGGCDPNTARLSEFRGPAAEQDADSWIDLDLNVTAYAGETPMVTADQTKFFAGVGAGEDSDSDEPVLPSRRLQGRSSARSSETEARVFSPSTQRSRPHSTEFGSARALPRRKRLHRRKGARRDSPNPHPDDPSNPSTSSGLGRKRCPVQCFVQRKMVGSQEMITIELPALSLRGTSDEEDASSLSGDMRRTEPIFVAGRASRRRARFSKEEEDLLVELKARRDPKLSWREIQRHFPRRTIGSLQVHYSTQLNGRLRRSGELVRVHG